MFKNMFNKNNASIVLAGLLLSFNAFSQQSAVHECERVSDSQSQYKADLGANKRSTIAIVTGSASGTYSAFGNNLAELVKSSNSGFTVCIKPSKGSLDNVLRMASNENAGLGIAQSDVIHHIISNNIKLGSRGAKELRLIAPLYNEEVHILASKKFKSIEDLKGKKVNVGLEKGGSWVTAVTLFQALYPSGKGIPDYQYLDDQAAIKALLNNEIDAMLFVAGKPVGLFTTMAESDKARLSDLHFVAIDAKRFTGLPYVNAEISAKDYSWAGKTTPTVAVKSQLISYDFSRSEKGYHRARCSQFEKIGSLLRSNISTLKAPGKQWHSKWAQVNLDARVDGWERDLCSWNSISIVTGSPSGTYFKIGQDIASVSQDAVFMEVKSSEGSVDNINSLRIESGENAAISIVQSDVIAQFRNSPSEEDQAIAKNLRLIMPLYNEEIHLLATKDIKSINDLAGKKLSAGSEKSGSHMTAKIITSQLAKKPEMVFLSKEDAFQKLKNGEIQAMLFVGGKPMKFFKKKLEVRYKNFPESFENLHIVPIKPDDLSKDLPYVESTISKNDYNWIDSSEPIPTMAVKSLLVSRDFSSKDDQYSRRRCEQINKIYASIANNIGDLKAGSALPRTSANKKHEKWQEVTLNQSVGNWVLDACAHDAKAAISTKANNNDCDKYLSAEYKAKHSFDWSKTYSACINQ